jgi:hypothetical protein
MSELYKKQIITEELYLEEDGLIKVAHHPEKRASERYFGYTSNYLNATGPTVESVVSKLLHGLNQQVSSLEVTINSQKNILKESVKNLRDTKAKIEEAKRFLGK